MSIFNNGFDANAVEAPQTDLLPVDWYPMVGTRVEPKQSASGGEYLDCEFEIIDGPCRGRKVWTNITTKNNNPTAQQIGLSQVSAWCKALGVQILKDSSDILHKPMLGHVKIDKGSNGYADKNKVVNYKQLNQQGQATTSSAPADAGASGKPPWMA